ncbi:GNAT family N-acetyltransferase [uncultured Roseobacter sp.]|uniref:GNAT family N-acetyltransferase n=1 Tax=uncultured Roseobacter sp. TaxID=114847 RepID=UPI002612881C|nr:GNAT family N-acetyltransferase [uncultured Roseobacter sp.]
MIKITFSRLAKIPVEDIAAHMSDPALAPHMPLLQGTWDKQRAVDFVAMKEARWAQDGLGHWAILADGVYVGWGGFQLEEEDWDFGLVLKPSAFGLGRRITDHAMAFARSNARIPSVTFLLPPTRTKLGALARMGAEFEGEVTLDGALFRKYRLVTIAP